MVPLQDDPNTTSTDSFPFEVILPSGEIISAMKKNRRSKSPDEIHDQINYRVTWDERELLARRAYDAGKGFSIQRIMSAKLFGPTAKKELEERREKHRRLGLRNTLFYSHKKLKMLGLKPHIGRPKKIHLPKKAA